MSAFISFLAAAVAALTAGVGAGLLARECRRLPRIEVVPWLVAAAGLTVSLAAQAAGYGAGFGPATFRAVQIGAQLVAPVAMAWGLVEVTGRSVTARFAGRLVFAAVGFIGVVILAIDPLTTTPYSKDWPPASAHYGMIPNTLLLPAIAVLTVAVAVVAAGIAGLRSRSEPAWREAFVVASAGGGAAVVIQLLRLSLPFGAAYAALGLLASALAWFAGTRSDVQRLREPGSGRGRPPAGGRGRDGYGDDTYGGLYRGDATGYGSRYRDDTGYGIGADTGYGPLAADTGYGQIPADTGYGDTGYGRPRSHDISDTGYGFYRDDTDGLRAVSDTGYGLYRDDTGAMVLADGRNGTPPGGGAGRGLAGQNGAVGTGGPDEPEEDEAEVTDQLYGQIAIYTLLDSRAGDFDELAREVVAKVKEREPDTLVFVMHTVPSAPMQRILYEVYRDQAAHERHNEQPYVRDFEERRKPYVLATNVIELGVRQAKVSPLAPGQPGGTGPGSGTGPGGSAVAVRPSATGPLAARSRSRTGPQPAQPWTSQPQPRTPAPLRPAAQPAEHWSSPSQPRTPTQPPSGPRPPAHQRPAPQPAPPRLPGPPPGPSSRPSRSRSAGEDDGFWTRPPGGDDDDDDGDFWTRGSRYR